MSVTALATKKDDQRAELRRAIAGAREAKAAVDQHRDAIERARPLVREAQTKLAAAGVAVTRALDHQAHSVAAAIASGGNSSPSSAGAVRAARAAEQDAADDGAAAKAALASLEADLADLESDAAVASRAVDRALAEMLEPICHRLIAEVRERHVSFLRAQSALCAVSACCGDTWSATRRLADLAGLHSDATAGLSRAAGQEWELALKALRENAEAEVPPLDEMTALPGRFGSS